MSDDLVGTMMDAGITPQEVRELFGEDYVTDHDPGAQVDPIVRELLNTASEVRQPPGPQKVVESLTDNLPGALDAKPVRVDTEESYREFRGGSNDVDLQALDDPENAEVVPHALQQLAQAEGGLVDVSDEGLQRGYGSQWITGLGRKGGVVGILDVVDMDPASVVSRTGSGLSPDQNCLFCGAESEQTPICGTCHENIPQLVQMFRDRSYASQILGFGERGSAASRYGSIPTTRYVHATNPVIAGSEDFYRQDTTVIFDDIAAVTSLTPGRSELIPLSYEQPDAYEHVSTWKQGDSLYASMRVVGWDGESKILTTATPYPKEVGIVVGYAQSAGVPPGQLMQVLDPLSRHLGASRLVPRLAASAPGVLRAYHKKSNRGRPHIFATMPVRK